MADVIETGASVLTAWRAQQVGPSIPEVAQWDQLLRKLGLTEREALDAITQNCDVGLSIRRFVQDACRSHFIPENVLLAMKLQRETANYE